MAKTRGRGLIAACSPEPLNCQLHGIDQVGNLLVRATHQGVKERLVALNPDAMKPGLNRAVVIPGMGRDQQCFLRGTGAFQRSMAVQCKRSAVPPLLRLTYNESLSSTQCGWLYETRHFCPSHSRVTVLSLRRMIFPCRWRCSLSINPTVSPTATSGRRDPLHGSSHPSRPD
jgi:hypothetical protein